MEMRSVRMYKLTVEHGNVALTTSIPSRQPWESHAAHAKDQTYNDVANCALISISTPETAEKAVDRPSFFFFYC